MRLKSSNKLSGSGFGRIVSSPVPLGFRSDLKTGIQYNHSNQFLQTDNKSDAWVTVYRCRPSPYVWI